MALLLKVILLMWVLSFLRTLVNLASIRPLGAARPLRFPRVSVIVPARDEERTIERTVRALLAQDYPELEVIVVNDRSVDATEAILDALADPRLIVVHGEEPSPGWLGKPWALHQGSRRATGELLLFVDADVIYQPATVSAAVAELERRQAALLFLFPHLEMRGFWEHVVMPNLVVFGFSFLPLWLSNRWGHPLLAIGGGPGNLVRRDAYDAAGGHEALRDAVVDDIAIVRLVRRHGGRTAVVRADRDVAVRMYHGLREIVEGFTKNNFAAFGYRYLVAVPALLLAVVFHILPYAFALSGDRIALATIALISVTRAVLFRAFRYRLDNAIFGHPLMIAAWCWILLRSIWVTGVRRRLSWRGRTYDAGRTKFGA
jgi:glycosyltransferase involved in cell wall biosynthesis